MEDTRLCCVTLCCKRLALTGCVALALAPAESDTVGAGG